VIVAEPLTALHEKVTEPEATAAPLAGLESDGEPGAVHPDPCTEKLVGLPFVVSQPFVAATNQLVVPLETLIEHDCPVVGPHSVAPRVVFTV